MHVIRPTTDADLGAVAALLARVSARPPALGCADDELSADWLATSVVAEWESGELAGFLGVRVRPDQGRAWLHGPFIDLPSRHPAAAVLWDRIADGLLDRVRALPPLTGCADVELFGYVDHRLLVKFAARHGFTAEPRTRMLRLDQDGVRELLLRPVPDAPDQGCPIRPVTPDVALHPAVLDLHAALSTRPNPAAPASWAGECTVLAAVDGAEVLGYAAGGATDREYLVDAVGVRPDQRGRGIGRRLVTELIRDLARRHGPRPRACAAVRRGDTAPERLFATLGFRPTLELTPYRSAR